MTQLRLRTVLIGTGAVLALVTGGTLVVAPVSSSGVVIMLRVAGIAVSRVASIRASRSSRSVVVNFHWNGWAVAL